MGHDSFFFFFVLTSLVIFQREYSFALVQHLLAVQLYQMNTIPMQHYFSYQSAYNWVHCILRSKNDVIRIFNNFESHKNANYYFTFITSLTLIEPINSEYEMVSFVESLLLICLLPFISISMTFFTNAFFPEILSARGATAIEAKINFGRDKFTAWSSSPT